MTDRGRLLLTAVAVALAIGILAVVLPGILTPSTSRNAWAEWAWGDLG